ncbi:MAG: response regulator, partial [Syntrophorhabdaceae bacterium]|nr:response regulator [Syntrophorhabdaceae bacterium]
TILIAARNAVLESATPNLTAGRYIHICITDNGIGIPEEHLDRVFDPYFTTKQKGSGLGLAICYSVIKNHQGHITVESTLGVGSTFHIYLPVCDVPYSGEKGDKQDMTRVIGGNVLVMDDEEAILEIVGDILAYHGFTVDFARDGEEALCLYQEKEYDAVILDLTVPGGMGGREAMKELLRIDPMVRAIVSSGYSNDPIMSDYRQYGFKNVIAKPYDLEELGEVLRSVMGGD